MTQSSVQWQHKRGVSWAQGIFHYSSEMRKKAEVALKCCCVLHSYVGTVFSHNKLLAPSMHPTEMEINPLKMTTVSGLPKWQDNINNNNKNTVTHIVLSPYGMHLSTYICIFPVTPEHSAEGCYHKCNFTDWRLTNTEDRHMFSQWFFSFFLQDAWIKRITHSLWPHRCSPPGESWPVQSRPPWRHGAHPLECWLLAGRGGRSSLPPGTPLHLQSAAVHGKVSVGKCL